MSDERDVDLDALKAWATTLWGAEHDQARAEIAATPGHLTLEQRVARIEDQLEIERVFRRYHALYDAHDIDGVLTLFTPDAVQVNGRGTFVGHASLRRSYAYLTSHQRLIMHYGTGLHVSLNAATPDAGMLTARYMALFVSHQGRANMHGGTYINRMSRIGGRWLIAEQRITYNWQFDVTPSSRVMGANLPRPEHPLSQSDLVEERYRVA